MTMAMQAVQVAPLQGPKILKIGKVQNGKIVEERIIRKRESVFVGSSEKNHFTVQSSDAAAHFELFQLVGSDYILNFTDGMRGKVQMPAGVQELSALRSSGAARNAGSHWQVKLNENARGRVSIGDVTLLFQFVAPPPVQPRPQLPAAARGGFVKGIDWMFTGVAMFSFMLHFGFIIYLENADWPMDQGIGEIPDSVARLIFEEPEPPEPETPPEDATAENTEEAEAEEAPPTKAAPSERPSSTASAEASNAGQNTGSQAESNAAASARMAEEAAASAEAMLLGALGSGEGAFADVLRGGAVVGNAADVLAQAEGVGVATGAAGGALRTRGGGGTGSGEGNGLGGLAARGGSGATAQAGEGAEVVEVRVRARTPSFGDIEDDGGDGVFDPAIVARQIRTRASAVKACHETELRRSPTVEGKVAVRFVIQTTGSVTNVQITENTTGSDSLAACVSSTIGRLRFNPGPDGGSVTFSFPFVFAIQQ